MTFGTCAACSLYNDKAATKLAASFGAHQHGVFMVLHLFRYVSASVIWLAFQDRSFQIPGKYPAGPLDAS